MFSSVIASSSFWWLQEFLGLWQLIPNLGFCLFLPCLCPYIVLERHQTYWIKAHLLQFDLLLTNDIFNNPISKLGHILRYWGLRQDFDFVFLGGHNLTHNMALGSKGTEIHLNKLLFPPKGNKLNECFLGTRS